MDSDYQCYDYCYYNYKKEDSLIKAKDEFEYDMNFTDRKTGYYNEKSEV